MVSATRRGETFSLSYPVARRRDRTADLLPLGKMLSHVVPPAFADVSIGAGDEERRDIPDRSGADSNRSAFRPLPM